ncbi:MAG TPA: SDR family oxidoreductase [Actinocrinis sp.]|nr:SDR family oxidoreductase [Actinocrinis sp.]
MRLEGKVAMITGAARALGRSHALAFAREGADLLLVDLARVPGPNPLAGRKDLETAAAACRRIGSTVVTAVADVRSQAEVDAAVAAGIDEFGRIDILVNNAGLLVPGGVRSHEVSEEDWNLVLDVNLGGTWRCCKAVLPHMVRCRSGSIINMGSTGSRVAFELYSCYVASKHAVAGLTKALALEYGHFGIRVNTVCASTVAADEALGTRSTADVAREMGSSLADYESRSAGQHPIGRLVTAAEVSAACLWLASSESSGSTGSELFVDGGFTAR